MTILIYLGAVFLLFLGLFFIYKPLWLVRVNKFARERIFNDNLLLLERRQKGVLALLIAFIFFCWGYQKSHYTQNKFIEKLVSTDRLLYQSRHHLQSKEYQVVEVLCERVLSRDPNNSEALFHLAAANLLLKSPQSATIFWKKAKKLDPVSIQGQRIKELVLKLDPSIKLTALP